jgi:tetratricopeptide (TPR) repeat protein
MSKKNESVFRTDDYPEQKESLKSAEDILAYLDSALVIQKEKRGDGHLDLAGTYTNFVNVFMSQGRYDDAIAYSTKALDILVKHKGEGDAAAGNAWNQMAIAHINKNNYADALMCFEKLLPIQVP